MKSMIIECEREVLSHFVERAETRLMGLHACGGVFRLNSFLARDFHTLRVKKKTSISISHHENSRESWLSLLLGMMSTSQNV